MNRFAALLITLYITSWSMASAATIGDLVKAYDAKPLHSAEHFSMGGRIIAYFDGVRDFYADSYTSLHPDDRYPMPKIDCINKLERIDALVWMLASADKIPSLPVFTYFKTYIFDICIEGKPS